MNIYLTDEEVSLLQTELYTAEGNRLERIARAEKTLENLSKDDEFLKKHREFLENRLEKIKREYEILDAISKKLVKGG